MKQKSQPSVVYEVECHACGERYDALKAGWCTRRSGERTLTCPYCNECFCLADVEYKQAYWEGLLQRLREAPARAAAPLPDAPAPVPSEKIPPAPGASGSEKRAPTPADASLVDLSSYLNPAELLAAKLPAKASEPVENYPVDCPHCSHPYDAAGAIWCYCLGADRSPCCPECLECWCAAPSEARRRLWGAAPTAMRTKRSRDLRKDFNPPPNPAPGAAERPLVLIAESDKHVLYIAARAVAVFGFHALLTGDGLEALALAESHRPDFILANAMLPRLNGRELCQRIKKNPALSAIPVALITALYTQSRYRNEAFKTYQVDDYLNMPVSVHQFRALLEKFLPAAPEKKMA
jgi:CheY-like chemotaxis protein